MSPRRSPIKPNTTSSAALKYSAKLSIQQQGIIEQEEATLVQVSTLLNQFVPQPVNPGLQKITQIPALRRKSYAQLDLLALTKNLADSSEEDATRIEAEIKNLHHISTYRDQEQYEDPYNLQTPYFGRLKVKIQGREREVLIGPKSVLQSSPIPIIDWRTAPLSPLFYRGAVGEVWDMSIGGREVEVEIITLRRLSIYNAALCAIRCPQGQFCKKNQHWMLEDKIPPLLQGGSQTSLQPHTMHQALLQEKWVSQIEAKTTTNPSTGTPIRVPTTTSNLQKHLRAMTNLLDPEQTKAINDTPSGILAIRGGAGSGKTTTALHRMAALHRQKPQHFTPKMMAAIVPGHALRRYIAGFLPALGVKETHVYIFDAWMADLRTRAMPFFEATRKDEVYAEVSRFKQHPVAWQILQQAISLLEKTMSADLNAILGAAEEAEEWLDVWNALGNLPLGMRLQRFIGWGVAKRPLPKGFGAKYPHPPKHWLARQRLLDWAKEEHPQWDTPRHMALTLWSKTFLNSNHLVKQVERLAPQAFSTQTLEKVCKNALQRAQELQEQEEWRHIPKKAKQTFIPPQSHMQTRPVSQQKNPDFALGQSASSQGHEALEPWHPEALGMSLEDDVLLLLTCEHVVGALPAGGGKPLRFRHVMVDEAQDMSHNAFHLVKTLCNKPLSITLAGDENQRMLFDATGETFSTDGQYAPSQSGKQEPMRLTTLAASYRCSAQILRFAQHVLDQKKPAPGTATHQGPDVQGLCFAHLGQATAFLGDALRKLVHSEPHASIALIARYLEQAQRIHQGLLHADIPKLHLVTKQDFRFTPGVEITDIEQARGLEFDYVVLLDVDSPTYPNLRDAKHTLHIAATRAAHQLWVAHCGKPSPLLPNWLDWHTL